jgi:hypothetical protein
MKKETIKSIFNFLEEKEKKIAPLKWKIVNNEPLTEEELNVKGNLNLSDTSITSLPEGLVVDGDLNLSRTEIESLPKGLKVYQDLYISYSSMEHYSDDEIREMIKPGYINGEIY